MGLARGGAEPKDGRTRGGRLSGTGFDSLRDRAREIRELGVRGTVFRLGWELKNRTGFGLRSGADASTFPKAFAASAWESRLPWPDPGDVVDAVRGSIPDRSLEALAGRAEQSGRGCIRCFGRWKADFGRPIDWYRDPITGYRRDPNLPWARSLVEAAGTSDVKIVWEVARFPQAYEMARAASFYPATAEGLSEALAGQLAAFRAATRFPRGVHWASGQEVVFRLIGWLFGFATLLRRSTPSTESRRLLERELGEAMHYLEENIEYARQAVYNNHLLSEALGLYVGGVLLGALSGGRDLKDRGRALLEEGVTRQFYRDGGYIQLSHNYQRVAVQDLLLACAFARAAGETVPKSWGAALASSVDFLVAHQNSEDGRLPNYGANDGALPCVLSTCDFSDFRPTLQAASLVARGERLYESGPWDEEAAWLLGPKALEAPLAPLRRRSVSFGETGFHVLRSESDEGTFATFRCGTIRDRFTQIDMLHFDLFWKGQNVLVDGGSYLYNGPKEWHDYFMETGSHNTLTVDGLDQMKHFRKFKCLYWTEAKLLAFRRVGEVAYSAGEHYGYRRHPGGCLHRRSIALHDDGTGVVVDTVLGEGRHRVRLHWLLGEFPHAFDAAAGAVVLSTPDGRFSLAVVGDGAVPVELTVARGQEKPPRGWHSRYFGEKVAVPSLAAVAEGDLPARFISAFGPGDVKVKGEGSVLEVRSASRALGFQLGDDGLLAPA